MKVRISDQSGGAPRRGGEGEHIGRVREAEGGGAGQERQGLRGEPRGARREDRKVEAIRS